MSNAIFPANVRGLTYTVLKAAEYNTLIQPAPNKMETRIAQTQNPIWHWALIYEYLYNDPNNVITGETFTDLLLMMGFYNLRQGSFDDFLYHDPDDYTVGPGVLTTAWAANTYYPLNSGLLVAGHYQKATVAGLSGSSAPTFSTTGPISLLDATPTAGGINYDQADVGTFLTITTGSGTATVEILEVNGGSGTGPVTEIATTPTVAGTGYAIGTGKPTTGGTGTGCTVSITGEAGGGHVHEGPSSPQLTWTDEGATYTHIPNVLAELPLVQDTVTGLWYSPLQRNLGGFYEDITDLDQTSVTPTFYANGVQQTAGTSPTGTYSLSTTPGLAIPGYAYMGQYVAWNSGVTPVAPITALFNFYFRVRFEEDMQDFEKFMALIWTIGGGQSKSGSGQVKFRSSRIPRI
jgi:hypothetical protein